MKKLIIIILLNSASLIVSSEQVQAVDSLKEVLRDCMQDMPHNALAGAFFLTTGLLIGSLVWNGLHYRDLSKDLKVLERKVIDARRDFLLEQEKYRLELDPSLIHQQLVLSPTRFPSSLNNIVVQLCAGPVDIHEVTERWLPKINDKHAALHQCLRNVDHLKNVRKEVVAKQLSFDVPNSLLSGMYFGCQGGMYLGYAFDTRFNVKNSILCGGLLYTSLMLAIRR